MARNSRYSPAEFEAAFDNEIQSVNQAHSKTSESPRNPASFTE
jgi:hypothetical protein